MHALEPERSIAQRDIQGGTGPTAIRRQLEAAKASLTK
jgi:argininosuccinate lyase